MKSFILSMPRVMSLVAGGLALAGAIGTAAAESMPLDGSATAAGALLPMPAELYGVVKVYPSRRQFYVEPSAQNASDSNPGTADAPWRTLRQAMRNLRPGDEIVIGPGVYRESIVVPEFTADAQTSTILRARIPGTAIVKGSIPVGGWVQVDTDLWAVPWTGTEPEQVYRNGQPLKQMAGTVFGGFPTNPNNDLYGKNIWPKRLSGDQTTMGKDHFYYSRSESRLYVRLSSPPAMGETLEVSRERYVMRATRSAGLVVDGMVFEHANTSFSVRHGAVYLTGDRNLIRNTTIRNMDAVCVMLDGNNAALLNNTISHCGQTGISAGGQYVTVAGNSVQYSNTRGFNKNWEAGGMKLTGGPALADAQVSYNLVANNEGDGIWFDTTPSRITIQGNTVAYNTGHGIHYEATTNGHITGNYSYGNGQRGIYLLESSASRIDHNVAFANAFEGIAIGNGSRSATDPDRLPKYNGVHLNTLAWNDYRRNRVQLMLPGVAFENTADRNYFHAGDTVPRYQQDWNSTSNPYVVGLTAWRARYGQDLLSAESTGPMPASLQQLLEAKTFLKWSDLPTLLRHAGYPVNPVQ